MPRRSSSSRLIGRDRELADLLEAVQRGDDERRVVLVSGEAGIGKTRLLAELVELLGAGAAPDVTPSWTVRVVRGSCLQIGDGELPFAPVLEILDALRADASLRARIDRLRRVLAGAGDLSVSGSAVARMGRFVEIYDLLGAAAGTNGLVVMIDDLHWADQSTLDLLQFLARRLREAHVVIVAAYRSDEIHRRHPLRPVLAELMRGYVRARIELAPLDVDDVVAQIAELRGDTTDELARRIADRADGNPFHVEELVALDVGAGALPESLRDVLLMRVATLEPAVVHVLGACAVVGQAVDDRLLSLALGLEIETVEAALAIAVDRSILVPSDDGRSYRFRHALLAEAVEEDLLPATRVDLHRRIARVLRDHPDLRSSAPAVAAAQLALHLDRAGEAEEAIEAYVVSAGLAFRALAWAEGVAAFERASELVARAPRAAPSDPRLRSIVTRVALALNWSGEGPRAIALLRDWIGRTDDAGDPVAAVELRMALSRIYNDVGEEAASRDMADQAAHVLAPDEHTAGGLDVLLGRASRAWQANRLRDALVLCERALVGSEELGDPRLLVRAVAQRGMALLTLGHIDRGLADFSRVDALQAEHGWLDDFGVAITNFGAALLDIGLLDLSLRVWVEGLRKSRELDTARSWDPWNLPGLAACHYLTGRWHEADGPIEQARSLDVPGMPTTWREIVAAELAAGRGDIAAADRSIDAALAHSVELEGDLPAFTELARAYRSSAAGDHADRLDRVDAGIRLLDGLDDLTVRSSLTAEGAGAAADLIEGLHGRRDESQIDATRKRARGYATLAADIAAGRLVPGAGSTPWWTANASLAAAEAARAAGSDDPAIWSPIAAAFADLGMRPRVAYVQFRHAAALLQAEDRGAAAAVLREARALAVEIGMNVLLRQIDELARAGRLDVEAGASAPRADARETSDVRRGDRWGLSDREHEVLALVAAGRTNGEIGKALFISTKTASVHVTHILDKLGVSSRTEAALLASRSGLLGAEPGQAAG